MRPLRWPTVQAIVEGRRPDDWAPDYPGDGDVVIARLLRDAGPGPSAYDGPEPWGHFQVVERATGGVIGGIGFLGPPEHGVVEVGYGIVSSRRGSGYATEALSLLVDVAFADPDVVALAAGTAAGNVASERVLTKAGFTEVPGATGVGRSWRLGR